MPARIPGPLHKLWILILRTILLDRYWYLHLKIENTNIQGSEVTKQTNFMVASAYLIPQPNPLPFPLWITPTFTDHPKENPTLTKMFKYYKRHKRITVLEGGGKSVKNYMRKYTKQKTVFSLSQGLQNLCVSIWLVIFVKGHLLRESSHTLCCVTHKRNYTSLVLSLEGGIPYALGPWGEIISTTHKMSWSGTGERRGHLRRTKIKMVSMVSLWISTKSFNKSSWNFILAHSLSLCVPSTSISFFFLFSFTTCAKYQSLENTGKIVCFSFCSFLRFLLQMGLGLNSP